MIFWICDSPHPRVFFTKSVQVVAAVRDARHCELKRVRKVLKRKVADFCIDGKRRESERIGDAGSDESPAEERSGAEARAGEDCCEDWGTATPGLPLTGTHALYTS